MTPAENDKLLAEIRAWLTASKIFYRSYDVREHLGPHYFVINSIVARTIGTNQIKFRDLLKGLPSVTQEGSSMHSTLSACLEYLRRRGFLYVIEGTTNTALAGRPQFPVSTVIKVREKLTKTTARYTGQMLRECYGRAFEGKYAIHSAIVSALIYEFTRGPFVRKWNELLESLCKKSPASVDARDVFLNKMTGSTEYYVLLVSLWEMKLAGDDEQGYRLGMLHSLHEFTRYVDKDDLHRCVEQLRDHGIIERVPLSDEEEHYRLADKHAESFLRFGEQLIGFRDEIKNDIEREIH